MSPKSPTMKETSPKRPAARKNKLGYTRSSVACAHCRRRKIRCLPMEGEAHGKCRNCVKLRRECIFSPEDRNKSDSPDKPFGNTPSPLEHSPTGHFATQAHAYTNQYSAFTDYPGQINDFHSNNSIPIPAQMITTSIDNGAMTYANGPMYDNSVISSPWQSAHLANEQPLQWNAPDPSVPYEGWTSTTTQYSQPKSPFVPGQGSYHNATLNTQQQQQSTAQHQMIFQPTVINSSMMMSQALPSVYNAQSMREHVSSQSGINATVPMVPSQTQTQTQMTAATQCDGQVSRQGEDMQFALGSKESRRDSKSIHHGYATMQRQQQFMASLPSHERNMYMQQQQQLMQQRAQQ